MTRLVAVWRTWRIARARLADLHDQATRRARSAWIDEHRT